MFIGDKGAVLRCGNFRRAVRWSEALRAAGMPEGFHFHDLRHTGNNLAAASGASTRELMHRMGHGSMRAALIYQHATSERDREIADAMEERIARESNPTTRSRTPTSAGTAEGKAPATGTPMARKIRKRGSEPDQ